MLSKSNRHFMGFTVAARRPILAIVAVLAVPLVSAQAAVDISTGTITTPAAGGLNSVTGVGFQPTAVVLWGVPVTNETVAVDAAQWIGIADDTTPTRNQKCIMVSAQNGASVTQRDIDENAAVCVFGATSGTPLALATLNSFDVDGFTLNYSGTPTAGFIIHYVAFGGGAQAFVGQVAANAGTASGVPFQPELVFTMTAGLALGGAPSQHSIQSHGWFNDNLDQWYIASYTGANGVGQTTLDSVLYTDGFIGQQYNGTRTWNASLTTINADGFSWTGTNADGFYYLALNLGGVPSFVGSFTKETTGINGATQELPDFLFTPQWYMLASGGEIDQVIDTPNGARTSFGHYDGVDQRSVTRTVVNNTTNADQRTNLSNVLGIALTDAGYAAAATAQPIVDSTPTIAWSPNDTTPYVIGVVGVQSADCVTNADCDDANACTDDTCDGTSICQHVINNANPCDDGDLCTLGDACVAGICTGTVDPACNATGLQSPTTTTARQTVWLSPANAFLSDNISARSGIDSTVQQDWTNFGLAIPGGATVDGVELRLEHNHKKDTDTGIYTCQLIDDSGLLGLPKDGPDHGHQAEAIELLPSAGGPSDTWGAVLTEAVLESAAFGITCHYTATSGGGANKLDVDHLQIIVYYTPECVIDADCGDLNQCTLDVCNAGSCQNNPATAGTGCDDGDACTVTDTCDGAGVCVPGSVVSCAGTGGQCAADSTCNPAGEEGNCDNLGGAINEGLACDDGLSCNLGETCQLGACIGGGPVDCAGTGDQCNADSTCNPAGLEGNCDTAGGPINEGLACDDALACNLGETCQLGACIGGGPVDCSGTGDLCNADSTCNPAGLEGNCDTAGGPINEGLACEDGLFCNGVETCAAGTCTPGADPCPGQSCDEVTDTCGCLIDPDCDDSNECTTDVCNAGSCENNALVNGTACTDDGLLCSDDVCQTGVCAHPPLAAATECRASTDECDPAEVCNGVALTCPTDSLSPNGTACTDDGLLCTDDTCSGGVCIHPVLPAATECRASTDECDPAEVCNGVALTCPTDSFLPDLTTCTDDGLLCSDDVCQTGVCSHPPVPLDTLCRASTDECDPQEVCDGVALSCPLDSFLPDLTTCTDDGLLCSDDVCQAGACSHPPLAAATECRASTDECDPAEVCDGVALSCPTDSLLPNGTACTDDGLLCSDDTCSGGVCLHPPTAAATECRASTDECDPAEVCNGVALTCPTDSFLPDLTTCTDEGLLCSDDVCQAGVCSHPAVPFDTLCRASTDECDPQEVCDGVALSCPLDSFLPDLTSCTDDGLLCSDDVCQSGVCSHPAVPLNTLCRASTDECDPQEVCDGVALSCPLDSFSPDLTACTDDGFLCSDDVCQSGVCSHPAAPLNTLCRVSTDECDPQEVCDGLALTCPTDSFLPDLTTCTDDGLLCSDDICQTGLCSHPPLTFNTLCRASTDECDPQEVCDGVALTCPLDSFLPDATVCTDDGLLCSDDICQSGLCSHPPLVLNTLCRASTDECDPQEVCDGVALACPLDSFLPDLTICTDDGLLCSDDICQTGLCSHPPLVLNTLCRASTDECDPQEVCDGLALTCPLDSLLPDLTTCTDDGLLCSDDICQTGLCSHPPLLLDTLCRPSTDECDPQEVCDGIALACPLDSFLADATVCTDDGFVCSDDICQTGLCSHPPLPVDTLCRASTDQCDPQEVCNGVAVDCPGDLLLPDTTPCDDGASCNVGEACLAGVCVGGGLPDCVPASDDCNTATCDTLGLEGNCDIITPQPNGTLCDDGLPCTTDACDAGLCIGSPNAQVTVNIDIGGLGNAVMRDVTFTATTCGGLVDTRVIPVVFDVFGSATVVLDNVEDTATWLAVREGHTLRALVPLSFVSCGATVNLTGAGALVSGDFQTAVIVQDNLVDISDFSILATAFNLPLSPDSSLGADATGDGVQGTTDFVAIQTNFLSLGDLVDACPGGTSLSGSRSGGLTRFGGTADIFGAVPRSSITVDELGFAGAERADLNGDGVVDTRDIRAFAVQHGFRLEPAFEKQLGLLESGKHRRARR